MFRCVVSTRPPNADGSTTVGEFRETKLRDTGDSTPPHPNLLPPGEKAFCPHPAAPPSFLAAILAGHGNKKPSP